MARAAPDRATREAPDRAGHARGRAARVASASARGATHRDPRPRYELLAGGDSRADAHERGHAVRHRLGAAPRADRGVGRGPATGGHLARPTPRPRALRDRVLRQRAHRRRLPAGRGARAPAARGTRAAPAHLRAGARQRPARRRPDRRHGLGGDPPRASRTPTRSSPRSMSAGRGFATTICSPICSRSSCDDDPPRRSSTRCTAQRHGGSTSTGTWSRRSATRSRRATGRTPPDCSPTTTWTSCSTAARRPCARCSPPSRPTRSTRTQSWPWLSPPVDSMTAFSMTARPTSPSPSGWPRPCPTSAGGCSTCG